MRNPSRLAAATLLCGSLAAQCCRGAQDEEALSENGVYRVLASSLTGTGHRVHGPYHYEFAFQVLGDNGEWRTVSTFERRWDNKRHFAMSMLVSPTGNGFLLQTSLEPALVLYGREGRRLREVRGRPGMRVGLEGRETGLYRTVRALEDRDGKRWQTRKASLFVPMGSAVGAELRREPGGAWQEAPAEDRVFPPDVEAESWLRRMLHWEERIGERQAAEAEAALRPWISGEEDVLEKLTDLGLSARPVLEAALAETRGAELDRVREALAALELRSAGHPAPHRNLELLCALLEHPDEQLAATARSRLLRILPEGVSPDLGWVREHRGRLRWDGESGSYRLRE